MTALDIKLLRDLKRLWPQALAVALVLACGVATLILATGAYRSLEETRRAYYERYRFGDVFASATRAPKSERQARSRARRSRRSVRPKPTSAIPAPNASYRQAE